MLGWVQLSSGENIIALWKWNAMKNNKDFVRVANKIVSREKDFKFMWWNFRRKKILIIYLVLRNFLVEFQAVYETPSQRAWKDWTRWSASNEKILPYFKQHCRKIHFENTPAWKNGKSDAHVAQSRRHKLFINSLKFLWMSSFRSFIYTWIPLKSVAAITCEHHRGAMKSFDMKVNWLTRNNKQQIQECNVNIRHRSRQLRVKHFMSRFHIWAAWAST